MIRLVVVKQPKSIDVVHICQCAVLSYGFDIMENIFEVNNL